MQKKKILIIEDEEDIRELLRFNLSREGFEAKTAGTGEEGMALAAEFKPDLIILDLMLPGVDGLEVCRLLKETEVLNGIPIIMVTARGEESDVVRGLELGADDYVIKPFSPKILTARVRAVLRRENEQATGEDPQHLSIHGLLIKPGQRQVTVGGELVELTFTEFNVLCFLARRPGWVFTRGQIVDNIRGNDYHVTERSVDVHILGLRKKLGKSGSLIETVRGVGYRFRE